MTLALFTEPFRVSIEAGAGSSTGHGMLLGLDTEDGIHGIVVVEDGSVTFVAAHLFTIDWRYDQGTDQWMDLDAIRSALPDQP